MLNFFNILKGLRNFNKRRQFLICQEFEPIKASLCLMEIDELSFSLVVSKLFENLITANMTFPMFPL